MKGAHGRALIRGAACLAVVLLSVFASPRRAFGSFTVYRNLTLLSLSDEEMTAAESIMDMVRHSETDEVTIRYRMPEGDFLRVWNAVNNTYFRYYSRIDMKAYSVFDREGTYRGIRAEINVASSRERYRHHLENAAKLRKILETITKGRDTDRKKVIAINNYVCKKLTWKDNAGTLDIALNTKYSKCTGYASLFMALCELSGIACCQVTGYADGGHDWNQVRIDDVWYYIDPTWNDKSGNSYMLTEDLWEDHTIWSKIYVIDFQRCGYKSAP